LHLILGHSEHREESQQNETPRFTQSDGKSHLHIRDISKINTMVRKLQIKFVKTDIYMKN